MTRILTFIFLTMLLWTSPAGAQVNTDQVLRIGQNAMYFEDYMLSIKYFNQVIQAKPYLAQPYFLRAIAKLNLEDYGGAEEDATQALTLNPFLTDAYEVRGVARQNLGRDREAVGDYDSALAMIPRNRQLLFNKALALTDIGEYSRADSTFTELLDYFPAFDNGLLGRARLYLATGDTVAASRDIDRALGLNRNALNAYIMRADIAIHSDSADYHSARADMDEAIRLQPRMAGLYINRAYLRYRLDDYFGAVADFDYAIQLEPTNAVARFNRGLLLAEVHDNDRAMEDFSKVLELNPEDYRARFNRAMLAMEKGDLDLASTDIDRVAQQLPQLPDVLYVRSRIHQLRGDMARASRDYKKALAMSKALDPDKDYGDSPEVPSELSQDIARKFNTLLTVSDNADIREEYNNSNIRGRVQDRNINIEIEPLMLLSYYSSPGELSSGTFYTQEVDNLNATRELRNILVITNTAPALDEATLQRHREGLEYYNSYLSTHTPRTIDYMGRAMDLLTLGEYEKAIADADRMLGLTPDYALGYLLRAQARYLANPGGDLAPVLSDLDAVVRLSPRMAPAWFDKGNIHYLMGDYTSAISAYTHAIELKEDMGQAYYNRGYLYLKAGNREAGIADLSKAGEMGILPAYNLIKRIK